MKVCRQSKQNVLPNRERRLFFVKLFPSIVLALLGWNNRVPSEPSLRSFYPSCPDFQFRSLCSARIGIAQVALRGLARFSINRLPTLPHDNHLTHFTQNRGKNDEGRIRDARLKYTLRRVALIDGIVLPILNNVSLSGRIMMLLWRKT